MNPQPDSGSALKRAQETELLLGAKQRSRMSKVTVLANGSTPKVLALCAI